MVREGPRRSTGVRPGLLIWNMPVFGSGKILTRFRPHSPAPYERRLRFVRAIVRFLSIDGLHDLRIEVSRREVACARSRCSKRVVSFPESGLPGRVSCYLRSCQRAEDEYRPQVDGGTIRMLVGAAHARKSARAEVVTDAVCDPGPPGRRLTPEREPFEARRGDSSAIHGADGDTGQIVTPCGRDTSGVSHDRRSKSASVGDRVCRHYSRHSRRCGRAPC